jgi:hypothetical protein
LLHGKRDFESEWTHCLNQQFTNGFIDPSPRNPLTERLGMFDSFALARILRPQPAVADVIANRHPLATEDPVLAAVLDLRGLGSGAGHCLSLLRSREGASDFAGSLPRTDSRGRLPESASPIHLAGAAQW